jgi:hypothetical protein
VIGAIEIVRREDVSDVIPGGWVKKQAAQDGLLCFDGVRWQRRTRQLERWRFATHFGGTGHRF